MSLNTYDKEYEFTKKPKNPRLKIKNNGSICLKKEVEMATFFVVSKKTKNKNCKKKFVLYDGKYISHKTRSVKNRSEGFLKINKIKILKFKSKAFC